MCAVVCFSFFLLLFVFVELLFVSSLPWFLVGYQFANETFSLILLIECYICEHPRIYELLLKESVTSNTGT